MILFEFRWWKVLVRWLYIAFFKNMLNCKMISDKESYAHLSS
jgi:hypothetical protein